MRLQVQENQDVLHLLMHLVLLADADVSRLPAIWAWKGVLQELLSLLSRKKKELIMGNLTYQILDFGEASLYKTAVIISGDHETAIVDAGFSLADGRRIVEAARATGKPVRTVFISGGDPDFYFGLQLIKEVFPQAQVLSTPAILAHIRETYQGKLSTWASQLGDNLPTEIILPDPVEGNSFAVEGQPFLITGSTAELPDHIYLWQPESRAILGGVFLFDGLHVWTADTGLAEQRTAWCGQLQRMLDQKPDYVVAGHRASAGKTDASVITYTLQYLTDFEQALAIAPDAASAQSRMQSLYPNKGFALALDLGTKVAKGEMKWG
jgi:glyoxylase-like metal-dependent hydrolase (beta-lactamase superfamily II)